MIEKKTVVDQIEITQSRVIQVRLGILLVEDGIEISRTWHRTVIPPGTDVAAQIDLVNEHLLQMNKSPIDDFSLLTSITPLIHTEGIIKEYEQHFKVNDMPT